MRFVVGMIKLTRKIVVTLPLRGFIVILAECLLSGGSFFGEAKGVTGAKFGANQQNDETSMA